ncbi:hypothetical protein FB451DRAFT_1349049 [Mycena latifolia]|nr:hypothetical protein FB451DRAFT_1349049 [Mycena latifolia]
MSRRLDISSLLCDEPPPPQPPKDPDRRSFHDQVVAETVVLAPHLRNNNLSRAEPARPPRTEQSLDALAHAAALAEKRRVPPDPPFIRTPPQVLRSPVEELHRPRTVPHFAAMPPPSRHVLEQQQQQQQQHQHHLRLLQQHHHQQQQEAQAQQSARQREHHEQLLQQERLQAHHHQWERERAADALGIPGPDHRSGRKSDPGQLRPLTSPSALHLPPSHVPHQQMEPPSKKRRYSDSPGPHPPRAISLKRGGERSILNPDPADFSRAELSPILHRPSSSAGHDAPQFNFSPRQRKTLGLAEERHGMGAPQESRVAPGSLTGRAKARKSDPDERDVSPYPPERRDYTTVIHVPERPREEYPVEDRKHKKSQSQGQSHTPTSSRPLEYTPVAGPSRRPEPQEIRGHGPPQRRPQPAHPPRQLKEEDAHEWLLEHFADPSPDVQSKRIPEPPMSPSPLPPASMTHVLAPAHTKRAPSPLVPATMPEAAVALEEELASVNVPPASKTEPQDDGMDVDMAVSELVKETLESGQGVMEVDVEDELLSLVDDRPRSRSITRPPSVSRVSSGGKPALRLQEAGSRHGSPMASAASPSSFVSPGGARASSMLPPSERGSMPPPASTATGQGKSKESSAAPRKKKEAAKVRLRQFLPRNRKRLLQPNRAPGRPQNPNPNLPMEPPAPRRLKRRRPYPGKSGSVAASASRSRSTSAMPGGSVGPESSEKHEDEEEDALVAAAEDDKLYCVCKTKYDEDRFMIACDKCDEWYHTQCVDMPDLVVDLVDQFFCPLCIEKNPNLSLKTTYKPRCRYGLDHPEPDSPKACHKPAQGAFSKYCSPECGLNNVKKRIENFTKKGGKPELLWDSVKDAQKREAVVIVHEEVAKENGDAAPAPVVVARVKPPNMGKVEREVANLNTVLDEVVTLREDLKEGMEIVFWRERLLELASERAEQVGQCGWDQRLCFGEEEWADFGAGVLDSYEEGTKEGGMQVDAEEWWCVENQKCDRHAGWQTIRARDVAKEKEKKEEALFRLTTRERELRKRIDDLVEPFNRSCIDPSTAAPLKSSKLVNGNPKGKTNGDSKKGKKRKNPS